MIIQISWLRMRIIAATMACFCTPSPGALADDPPAESTTQRPAGGASGLLGALADDSRTEGPADGASGRRAVQLFDGTSLGQWDGDPDHWRVEDGAIVGEIPPGQTLDKNTWLVWRGGEVADFDLRLRFRLTGAPAANSGIQFRCQVENIDHVSGYQADLDQGQTWLGRIYDEHGRGLLVERGTRVRIPPDGTRTVQVLAPANQYAVLFRENDWNEYRIVAIGEHIAVFVNGTLFAELLDQQTGEKDLRGSLALQLHSGPQTRIEFRDISLEHLRSDDDRLGEFTIVTPPESSDRDAGVVPKDDAGNELNLGFEAGDLSGWTATGNAFNRQPIADDSIAQRWPGQTSRKNGDYFIGGYEILGDHATGTLTSAPFTVTHPFASFLIGGGADGSTRVELVHAAGDAPAGDVIFSASGNDQEQMRRVVADLREYVGQPILLRLVDENPGAWGHLNFDDFRFQQSPGSADDAARWRSTANPLLQHLIPNPTATTASIAATDTVGKMFVPDGFSADLVAAEPDLYQPMAFTFDARGRLWIVEGNSYPQKRPPGQGLDRILIFSDNDHNGTFEHRTVFIEGLNLVSGMEVGHGGVWVGAAPELLFIPDRNGDDIPDSEPQILLDGFSHADTHETLNSFTWGPDGWLYGNQGIFNLSLVGRPGTPEGDRVPLTAGVWRYHPTRHQFEVFAHGGSNQWGLDYDEFGQIFMTHCRSYWGQGPTTHVMQGGHYWNQVNSGYAPFISAVPLPDMPWMRNYLLASARYGHGEGGAGKPGSRQVYGGHSHVGTMIYLGDNWPAQYRNHLFTHNLHGHQMNHQINRREAGGFNTVHAGYDVLFCADQQYIGVDLKYGPDGAVYISDWYDQRHCHNPVAEQWDRGNGRIYRVKYDATYRPANIDYTSASDSELVAALLRENEWHVRTATRVLSERASEDPIAAGAVDQLRTMATSHSDPSRRLRALWALNGARQLDRDLIESLMGDDNEYVRAWAVQLGIESLPIDQVRPLVQALLTREQSLLVRRYLASAIQRVPSDLGWNIATVLGQQPENAEDRDLPLLVWYGVAKLMDQEPRGGFVFADSTRLPVLADYALWYSARLSEAGRAELMRRIASADGEEQRTRLLRLLELGVRGMRGAMEPPGWAEVGPDLYDAPDEQTRRVAQTLGATFGDERLFERMRQVLADEREGTAAKRHALSLLESDDSPDALPLLLQLVDSEELVSQVLPLLSRYDHPEVAVKLIERLPHWSDEQRAAAMEVLASRAEWSESVLDAIARGDLPPEQLTAYYARQMSHLGNERLNQRLEKEWGALGQSSEEKRDEIAKTIEMYKTAPLWAYSGESGAKHFGTLCASCHQPDKAGKTIAPSLAGTGSKGIEYVIENIIDPNAVIGRDFQARVILTTGGRVINGLVEEETESAIVIRTANDSVTIAKDDIEQIEISPNSFMPEGLLKTLSDREKIELFKYLMSL